MASPANVPETKIYALVDYEDDYVQPLILAALEKRLPSSSYDLITSLSQLPTTPSRLLQFQQYESIDFSHLLENSHTSLANSYIIRKALIRKHYLSTTVSNWVTKYPDSVLKQHVKPSVEFEVDYAEFLDDALVEAWELRESWERCQGKGVEEREWWILKPGMSERGQGIRLFSSEEELTSIFEEWDPASDDEEEEDGGEDARSDAERSSPTHLGHDREEEHDNKVASGIITSHLRHFIAQPYIHPPLILSPPSSPSSPLRKFHIRTYVLATGALKIYVYKPMLALFASTAYTSPWDDPADLTAHLTNTCLQSDASSSISDSVCAFWDLPSTLPEVTATTSQEESWKDTVFSQIRAITAETFLAAARGMSIHFQPLPNAFELFGLDFLVAPSDSGLTTYLLEVNAFPDFRQTGENLKGLIEGLFEDVVDVGISPFFGLGRADGNEKGRMVQVLDVDLGRR